ncbi:flagellar filament capping protein FliD [Phytopseudomonas daroniae]|uniref:flagellar filament capping protein FliD n=1 Tax=Phytopseudomonas daroniae TaxID=2487519 RepID=UPI00103846AE|nr:flagellar filament capping protein FliD [Pseudomonas daroniae]TBU77092.1 flagellar cap protein FliD [Pseudomonas daroniae]
MAISSIVGLGSGLDITAIVEATVAAEKAPKQAQIDRQTSKATTSLTAIGTLKAALENFEASMTALKSSSTSFAGLAAKSSSESVATVKTASGAVTGSYALEVESLAKGSRVASATLAGGASTQFASGGTLKIEVGTTAYNLSVSAGASLTDIRDSINSQLTATSGISANIVTDANGSRLVLSSETTGAGTDIYVTGSGDLAQLNVNVDEDGAHALTKQSGSAAGYITEAADAVFTLDGLEMTSKSNTVSALSGLSITLAGTGSTTLSVTANTDGIKESIESFVSAYNTLMTVSNALTSVSTTTDEDGNAITEAGALLGDATMRSLMSSLRNALVEPASGGGSLSILAQLGVTTNKDGTLAIDDAKLSSGIEQNYDQISSFFTGSDGLFSRMSAVNTTYIASGGILATRTDALEATKKDLETQQAALDTRVAKLETNLYSKYNNMDVLVAQLTATSNSVLATLEALNNKDR